ncbi:Uncharacterized protein Adt_45125 [Abeliophyllum distichum]|uniref:Uncharacterized protein n=1 Tax=Abeliophyllum distichum TaxID=126358 RepID=A0ABD1PCT7_9LAMI
MSPKSKATAQDKGKGHVSGSSTRTRPVVEPPYDRDIPRFRTDEIKDCYTTTWASKVCHKERQVTRNDFFHHLLERVIQHCGWQKVADAPHAAYPTLIREFFANFNLDIDVPESPPQIQDLARLRKIDLGAHIFEFIRELATAVDSQCMIPFSCLISGLCLTQGVSLFPTEESDPPAPILNARSVENSKTKIAAGGCRVHATPAMNAGEDYPDDAAPRTTTRLKLSVRISTFSWLN